MKAILTIIAIFLISFSAQAIHFWQPYPINKTIVTNGSYSRLELSVYDSLLSTWKYYNTPFFINSIDTLGSTGTVAVYKTYLNGVSGSAYGFIIYDQDLHQFAAQNLKNVDPNFPGADLTAFENSVRVAGSCCVGGTGSYNNFTKIYLYDINKHQWIDTMNENHTSPDEWAGLTISYGGYTSYWYDDYAYNPTKGQNFYHPPTSTFPGIGFYEPFIIKGNQDIILCQGGWMLANGEVTIGIYDPWFGIWKNYIVYEGAFSGDESTFYLQNPLTNKKLFGAFDDSLHKWKLDTVNYNIVSPQSKDRVVAYVDTTNIPQVHVQTYSPSLHAWVKDSVIASSGVNNLSISKSTVNWIDNNGIPGKFGYNDTIGWGNFDTPVQLLFKIIDKYPTMGVPLVYVRSYSYGIDSAHFYFSDGGVSEYQQGSLWHQFKVNGSYNLSTLDTFEVCIETVADSGLVTMCQNLAFTSCSVGGVAIGSDSLICNQDTVILTLTGNVGAIQWQSLNIGGSWTNITSNGYNNDTIILIPTSQTYFRALVVNGSCPPAYSNLVAINVVPTQINITSAGDSSICRGMPVGFQADSSAGMLSFIWTYPSGWNMNNDSTSFLGGTGEGTSGNVTVYATTICGATYTSSMALYLNGPDTTIYTSINSNGIKLSTHEFDADWFQWLLCPLMTPIPGEIQDFFTPQINGSYALALSVDGCVDTSNCHDVIVVGIQEQPIVSIKAEPNPVEEILSVNFFNLEVGNYAMTITDIFGKKVFEDLFTNGSDHLIKEYNVNSFASGVYFATISSNKINQVFKFVKK